ncbi:helix-turn-helix domain-containing protein [Qingshengfaniella alkalisoli]|uniref:Helix-turn-helix transcriptional regulator n=1 Tax=Qingshengfaniella alkalisoli TaxID=2599296 RepID=A0A5B8J011_9RHOB|nr:XRE family transcriptional regulator [Qingshengfaniella alkalisoli]QDY71133.1 helix-turn-helix transcriptional regulator [Qingshengfaniella alkalisoli]
MKNDSDIHERLAAKLKSARKDKGLSLDAVSKLSGVSRSMVSQIERGESSPTVATLWNLTQALNVDFAGLIGDKAQSGIDVIRADDAPTIETTKGVRIRILSPPEAVGEHEVYDLNFASDGELDSDPHGAGCRESLTLLEGSLTVRSGSDEVLLAVGDTARYLADRHHSIHAGKHPARALLIVQDS